MAPATSGSRHLFHIFLGLWLALLVAWMNLSMERLEETNDPRLPFGVISTPAGIVAQDFSYQMLFFRSIRDRLVPRIYTMAGQEQLMRQELPRINSGMSHAYSPVAFVLILPLLALPAAYSYLAYIVLVAIGILLLFRFSLLPRVDSLFQLAALLICVTSVCVWADFAAGQSALLTTSLLGALWAILRREDQRGIGLDFIVAILFWALCLKPSVAIIPFFLLLGDRAWRALSIGVFLLLATWIFTADRYGGWLTGLRDYSFLLNHYHNGGMGDFMRRGHQKQRSAWSTTAFALFPREKSAARFDKPGPALSSLVAAPERIGTFFRPCSESFLLILSLPPSQRGLDFVPAGRGRLLLQDDECGRTAGNKTSPARRHSRSPFSAGHLQHRSSS